MNNLFRDPIKLFYSCVVIGTVWTGLSESPAVWAHGVELSHSQVGATRIFAKFDSGEPMSGAQVRVYSPDNPQDPWLEGVVDPQGNFFFLPDPGIPGTWEVMIRQAGHGGVVTLAVGQDSSMQGAEGASLDALADRSAGSLSPLHRGLLMGSTVWGLVGTALFFARRRS
ncbi:MAG: carboxypeptidase-like regulatory domain-containing protein [Cyanophyceae cyanobacterium]